MKEAIVDAPRVDENIPLKDIINTISAYQKRNGLNLTDLYVQVLLYAKERLHPAYLIMYHTFYQAMQGNVTRRSTTYFAMLVFYERILKEQNAND